MIIVTIVYGYPSYKPWNLSTFWSSYTMQIVIPPLFIIWKVLKRTKWVKAHEVDLVWERPLIDAYEDSFLEPPVGFWREVGQMVGIGRSKGRGERRANSVAQVEESTEESKA
jgi:amino acid transporter